MDEIVCDSKSHKEKRIIKENEWYKTVTIKSHRPDGVGHPYEESVDFCEDCYEEIKQLIKRKIEK